MRSSWIHFILAVITFFSGGLKAAETWPAVPFAEVRAYSWPTENAKGERKVILPGMKLREDVLNKDGAILSADQVKRLQAAVTGEHAKHGLFRCYDPHNAVVFYDAKKKPVAYVEICFDCLGAHVEPGATAEWKDFPALAKIFSELKLPIGSWESLERFNKFFDALRKE